MHREISLLLMILTVSAFLTEDGANDEYCLVREGGRCQICAFSYPHNGKCVVPATTIPNCLQYKSETECFDCKLGGYVNTFNNTCDRLPQTNCLNVDDNFNCFACAKGLRINYHSCADESIKCRIENCEICVEDREVEFCSLCKDGYVAYRGPANVSTCVKENEKTKGCWMFDYDSHECASCKVNFYFDEGKCVKSTKYFESIYLHATIVSRIFAALLILLL